MNKALAFVLMFSALAMIAPLHAVETRAQERARLAAQSNGNQNQIINDESEQSEQDVSEQNDVIQNETPIRNRKALIATAAIATATTAAYLYTSATSCSNVVQAYCAGTASSQALNACRVYWPMIPVVGTIGCWLN